MSMLARYKKGGAIIELVKMIEDSPEGKRAQLLNMIRAEDPEFAARVEARLFSYEMFKGLDSGIVAEVIAATPAKMTAIALSGESNAQFVALVERCLGSHFADYKSEKEILVETPPNPAQIEAAQKKIIAEARKLEAEGKIKLPFSDIGGGSEGSEHRLAGMGQDAAPGTATEEEGIPPLESFGIEAPPPGLAGERLEQYFKNQLG